MRVELRTVTIRELVAGFQNNEESGVTGMNGALSIRPAYQREFVYKDKQQIAVIDSVMGGMPLNVMYWVDKEDGTFEVLDGQQRTMSICNYYQGMFAKNYRFFHNLDQEEKEAFLDYEIMVYTCKGTNQEKLAWFETINIAGEKLTQQELRNATYAGSWLSDAKRYFSRTGCGAYGLGSSYVKGSPIRQDYLETTLSWISEGNIENYMAQHQHDENATELWDYFRRVINWVKSTFTTVRAKEMKGINWGKLYNQYGSQHFDPETIEAELQKLLSDEDVTKKSGVYLYVLTREEKWLNIRSFSDRMKRQAYEAQKGVCPRCSESYEYLEMEGDHITPWSEGGTTTVENLQMLCKACNRTKANH